MSLSKDSSSIQNRSTCTYLGSRTNWSPISQKSVKSPLIFGSMDSCGAKQYRGTPTIHKSPLTVADLLVVSHDLVPSTEHDDLLFYAQLNTGFTRLLCLGELTWPNQISLCDYRKVTLRSSLELHVREYLFWLPTHKADTTFEGNRIVIQKISNAPNLCSIMEHYTRSCDTHFTFHPQLWIKANGTVPLHSWFIACLQ